MTYLWCGPTRGRVTSTSACPHDGNNSRHLSVSIRFKRRMASLQLEVEALQRRVAALTGEAADREAEIARHKQRWADLKRKAREKRRDGDPRADLGASALAVAATEASDGAASTAGDAPLSMLSSQFLPPVDVGVSTLAASADEAGDDMGGIDVRVDERVPSLPSSPGTPGRSAFHSPAPFDDADILGAFGFRQVSVLCCQGALN